MAETELINAVLLRYPHFEALFNQLTELSDGAVFRAKDVKGNPMTEDPSGVDVWMMPLIKYIAAKEFGTDVTAIPVFPTRRFVQWMVEMPTNSNIREPQDLAGKRIAMIDWGHGCAVAARGVLAEDYGVDLSDVSWLTIRPEQVVGQVLPTGVKRVEADNLNELLLNGEADAVLTQGAGQAPAAGIRRLWEDPEAEIAKWYESARFFPLVHVVVVRDSALDAHNFLAKDLFKAFEDAKQKALVKWNFGSSLPEEDRAIALQSGFPGSNWGGADRSFLGQDPMPGGLAVNRDAIEKLVRYGFDQKALQHSHSPDELFAPVGE